LKCGNEVLGNPTVSISSALVGGVYSETQIEIGPFLIYMTNYEKKYPKRAKLIREAVKRALKQYKEVFRRLAQT